MLETYSLGMFIDMSIFQYDRTLAVIFASSVLALWHCITTPHKKYVCLPSKLKHTIPADPL